MAKIIDDETIENVCILAKDTDGVEPLSHIFGDENVFRDDVVTNGDDKEAMLFNAPKAKEGQYQVPKTIG